MKIYSMIWLRINSSFTNKQAVFYNIDSLECVFFHPYLLGDFVAKGAYLHECLLKK